MSLVRSILVLNDSQEADVAEWNNQERSVGGDMVWQVVDTGSHTVGHCKNVAFTLSEKVNC